MLSAEENELLTRTGPGTVLGKVFRSYWQPALLRSEVPAPDCAPVRVKLLGEELLAFRTSDGKVNLIDERCPHRRASLFFGRNEGDGIRCAYHGWKFAGDGQCMEQPNEPPGSKFFTKVCTTSYPTAEAGGVVWAYLGEGTPPELPKYEWAQVPDSHRHITKVELDTNYLQSMEGDIDSSHTGFLHAQVGKADIEDSGKHFDSNSVLRYLWARDKAPKFFVLEAPHGLTIGARRSGGRDHYYWRITQWMAPSSSMIPGQVGGTQRCNFRVPATDSSHTFFRIDYCPHRPLSEAELYDYRNGTIHPELIPGTFKPVRNLENDFLIDRALQRSSTFSGIRGIVEQDYAVAASMGPIADRTREKLGTSDLAIIRARRVLMRLAEHVSEGGDIEGHRDGEAYFKRSPALLIDRELPLDEGAKVAMDASQPWSPDVPWATVQPVLDDDRGND